MRARIIHRDDVLKIVDLLRKDHEVLAPFRGRGRDSVFDIVTDENRDQIQIHIANPYHPPKRYVFPQIERIMKIRGGGGDPRVEPTYDGTRRAIFGIRSCDVAGIWHLDRFFLGRDFRDVYYERHRRGLFLVNVVCTDPTSDIDESCFCVCADTGPAARDHFDLQLMDLGGGEFMAVAGTPAGAALFADPIFKRGAAEQIARRRRILGEVRKQFKEATTSWFSATVRYVSQGKILDKTWEEIGVRCLECGGCTYVCPACTCFTVRDREVGAGEWERVRLWDACALGGFTRMAGGHNPRRAVHDRRNRRFFRKLAHYFIQRELSMACVGCGRCTEVCHGDIGMPSVVEMIRRATAQDDKIAPERPGAAEPKGQHGSAGD
ncbi:MAG TPA: 4Fe-4S dicluster domain-containing protein [Verrucomicrobiae bacterium]|nr:4Fe-4S dicluster domain-containing protein [Verrucomicrobiae bacterium]